MSFQDEIKKFVISKGFAVAKNCLRPESMPLTTHQSWLKIRKRITKPS